jgi:hypothetical protein
MLHLPAATVIQSRQPPPVSTVQSMLHLPNPRATQRSPSPQPGPSSEQKRFQPPIMRQNIAPDSSDSDSYDDEELATRLFPSVDSAVATMVNVVVATSSQVKVIAFNIILFFFYSYLKFRSVDVCQYLLRLISDQDPTCTCCCCFFYHGVLNIDPKISNL